jgi:hypothetical protein
MITFTMFSRRQPSTAHAVPPTGPTLIDPKDFQHIGGGSPRGTWTAPPAGTASSTPQSPRGTW